METQKILKRQSNLEREKLQLEELKALTQVHFKTTVTKTEWYWHKNRNIDQWNRKESPQINSSTYDHLIYDKRDKNGEQIVFSINGAGKTGPSKCTCEIRIFLNNIQKINSKSVKDLNLRLDIIKRLGKHRPLFGINSARSFFICLLEQ